VTSPDTDLQPRAVRSEWLPRGLVVVAVALVFFPVLRHPTQVVYSEISDLLSGHQPYRELMTQSLRARGRLPLYDPTAFGGIPLVGDPQSGLVYPPNWLHALPGGPAWFGWSMLLHLCVGAWGVLFWLRGHFPSAAPRLSGALAFALAGKWFAHLVSAGHVVFLPLAWVPWQCGLIDRVARTGSPRSSVWLAAVTALVLTGMHPQLLLYSQLLVALYAAIAVADRTRTAPVRSSFLLAGAGVLGLALAASQLLPTLASADLFVRGELPYVVASWKALTPGLLLGMLLPGQASGHPTEDVAFLGVAALACVCFAPWAREQRRLVAFFVAILLACVLYALGSDGGPAGGLHRLLFELVPGFDLFRRPSRMLLVAGVPLAFLTAAGIQALCRGPATRGKRILAGTLVAAGVALAGSHRSAEAGWALCGLALPAVCLLPWRRSRRRQVGWVAVLVVFVDLARFDAPQVRTRPLESILGETQIAASLRAPLGQGRVLGLHRNVPWGESSLPAAYAAAAGLESLGGYNPLIPRATYGYMRAGVAQREPRLRIDATTIRTKQIASRPHLDLFNTRWIAAHAPIHVEGLVLRRLVRGQRVYLANKKGDRSPPRDVYVYENVRRMPRAALVRRARAVADSDAAIAEISRLDPRSEVLVEDPDLAGQFPGVYRPLAVEHHGDEFDVELDAGAGGYLVLSELWYPGWRADDAGEPVEIHRANGIFQVVRLGPGSHHLHFRYRPRSWVVGRGISLAALAVTAGLLLLAPRRARVRGARSGAAALSGRSARRPPR
jgi:hypothetical protein